MSNTVVLTGVLPFVLLVAALLAIPVSFLLLALYRRSVRQGMSALAGNQIAATAPPTFASAPAAPLEICTIRLSSEHFTAAGSSNAYRAAVREPLKVAAAYTVAGFVFAAIMTAAWLAATHDSVIVFTKVSLILWCHFWPAVIAAILIIFYDRMRRLQVLGAYFAVLSGIFALAMARNPQVTLLSLLTYWIILNAPPTLVFFAFLAKPIRAVGPLVLVFMLALAVGSQSLLTLASRNDDVLRVTANFGFSLGLSGNGVFIGMIVCGMFLFALPGWPLLKLLGKRYEQKRISERSLMLDAMWLVFGVVQSVSLAFEGALWILTGFVAFAGYKLAVAVGLKLIARGTTTHTPHTLLLLRVFALGKRSEQLFDRFRKHWQHVGNIAMIAGPDLVAAAIEPHEFLDFLSGRLARRFVSGSADLEARVAAMDAGRDADGGYRINEFFCRADTWQSTMEKLAATSQSIFMDLRSFGPANAGCLFELGRLLDRVELDRTVFLVDETTDQEFLRSTLETQWQQLAADSPNRTLHAPTLRLAYATTQSEKELKTLLHVML